MADFRTDPCLTEEQRLEIAGDFWLEAAYNIRKKKEEDNKYSQQVKKDKEIAEKKTAEMITKDGNQ